MEVVFDGIEPRQRLNIGDIVEVSNYVFMMIKSGERVNVVNLKDASIGEPVDTCEDWLDFWDENHPNFKIYPASQYIIKIESK